MVFPGCRIGPCPIHFAPYEITNVPDRLISAARVAPPENVVVGWHIHLRKIVAPSARGGSQILEQFEFFVRDIVSVQAHPAFPSRSSNVVNHFRVECDRRTLPAQTKTTGILKRQNLAARANPEIHRVEVFKRIASPVWPLRIKRRVLFRQLNVGPSAISKCRSLAPGRRLRPWRA